MAPDELVREPEHRAELADLVLEQIPQRLDQSEAQIRGKAADVVVQLDARGRAGVTVARLDHVGIEGALGEHSRAGNALGRGLEDLNESVPDSAPLLLWICHALEIAEELLLRAYDPQIDLEVIAEG